VFTATENLQAKPWELGLLGAAVTGTYALFCPIFGRLLRRADIRRKAIAVCVMYLLVGGLAPVLRSLWLLTALIAFLGFAGAVYWPMVEGVVCEGRAGAEVRRVLGTFNVLWCGGTTAGTLLAGPLYDLHPNLPFHVALGLAAIVLVLFLLTPSPHATGSAGAAAGPPNHEEAGVPAEVAAGFLYLSKVMVFLAYFTYGSLRALFPKYGTQLGFSATIVSSLLFMTMLAQTGVFLLFRNTGFWHYRYWPLLVTTAAATASFFAIGSVSSVPLLAVLFVCIGLFLGCSYFSSIYYSMARPKAGVESAAWHEMTLGTGTTLGPILGGFFAQQTGSMTAPFMLSGAVATIGLGIAVQFFLRRVRIWAPPGGNGAGK
jgi:MFS family permease